MAIRYQHDDSQWRRELRRLTNTRRLRADLEDVLRDQFAGATEKIHTYEGPGMRSPGSLKASGRMETSWSPVDHEWTGTLTWSDPAVEWELFHNAERDPDGGHRRWWDELPLEGWRYEEALERHLRGDGR